MLKVLKFGGSSMADTHQLEKVRSIVESDPGRRVVVVSAAGKRFKEDHKITDLLYLCHAHLQYGVSCDGIFDMVRSRYLEIRDQLGLSTPLEEEFDALRRRMDEGISADELVSRGEYFAARIMADYLGFDFLDSSLWLRFRMDGTVDEEASYGALRRAAAGRRVVIPGFYGVLPDGSVHTFSRGGSDITGALAAAALDADVYENWTDVSGFLMADPKIVPDPRPIERITYAELRELSYIGAQVLHEGTVSPVREKNIPLNIRNTNQPDHPGTMIRESFDESETERSSGSMITGIAGKKGFSVITLTKNGMSSEQGTVRRTLEILERYRVYPLRHRLRVAGGGDGEGRALFVSGVGRHRKGDQARQPPRHRRHGGGGSRGTQDGVPARLLRKDLRQAGRERHQYPHDHPGAGGAEHHRGRGRLGFRAGDPGAL